MKDDELPICAVDMADTRAGEGAEVPIDQTPPAGRLGRPHRSIPDNFAERFVRVGWFGAPDEFNAHDRSIGRWLHQCGRDELILARARYVEAQRVIAGRARRKRYCLGRTLAQGVPKSGE